MKMKNFQQQQQQSLQQQRRMMGGKAWLDQKRRERERIQQMASPVHPTTNKFTAVENEAFSLNQDLNTERITSFQQPTSSKGCVSRFISAIGNLVGGIIGSLILASIAGTVAATFLPGDLPFAVAFLVGILGLIYTLSKTWKAWEG
jgi:hypothetical protein